MIIRRQARRIAAREMPSKATKMSLLGAWTRTPGRRPAAGRAAAGRAAGVAAGALAPRFDRRRDNVPLLYLLALVGVSVYPAHGLVGIDGDDRDFADIFGPRLLPEHVELVAGKDAVTRPDRDLAPTVRRVDP